MTDIYLYCYDRTIQKKVKDGIQEDTGIQIRRLINSMDRIQEDYGIGIFVYDYTLDLNYEFKPTDIIISMEKMHFNEWLTLYKKGLDVVDCSDNFKSISWRLVNLGIEGAFINGAESAIKYEQIKYGVKDHIKRNSKKLITVYSPTNSVGQSTTALNMGYIIKDTDNSRNVLVIDRDKSLGGIKYLAANNGRYEVVEGSSMVLSDEVLYKDTERDIFILCKKDGINIVSDVGNSDIVNQLDRVKRHFDHIIVDTDTLIDRELVTLMELSSDIYTVIDSYKETSELADKFITNISNKVGINANDIRKVRKKDTGETANTELDAVGNDCKVYIYDRDSVDYKDLKEMLIGNKVLPKEKRTGLFR